LAVSFDYGQKHIRELTSASALSKVYGAQHLIHSLSALEAYSGLRKGDPTEMEQEVSWGLMPRTWKPARNIVMLSVAAAALWTYNIHIVVGGWHQEDYPGYPDCRREFLIDMECALESGTGHPIRIWAPLLHKTKKQIVQLGYELGVPFEKTWSCYQGEAKPCHVCDACVRREAAFLSLLREDPLCKEQS
jgi:7-cyano-7-deazaguanine synthase